MKIVIKTEPSTYNKNKITNKTKMPKIINFCCNTETFRSTIGVFNISKSVLSNPSLQNTLGAANISILQPAQYKYQT